MRAVMAFLATSGVAHDDGTISVLGGGIHSFAFSQYPATIPNLSLICQLEFDEAEFGQEHVIAIRVLDPQGHVFLPLAGMAVVPRPQQSDQNGVAYFQFVYNIRDISFTQPGLYQFVVGPQETEAAKVKLRVTTVEATPAQVETASHTLASALQAGFEMFVRGDRKEALRMFLGLVERFPDSPDAHNNLGFTLLASSQIEEALQSFEIALSSKPQFPELVRANIATCQFLLGRPDEALAAFEELIKTPLTARDGCVLFGLGRSDYQLIQLISTADFLALMALNGGRSALRAARLDRATLLAQVAQTGVVTLHGSSRETFERLLRDLVEDRGTTPSVTET